MNWGRCDTTAPSIERTWKSNNPTPIPAEDYAAALEGLADRRSLRERRFDQVNPGGWIEGSLRHQEHVYSKAVAPRGNCRQTARKRHPPLMGPRLYSDQGSFPTGHCKGNSTKLKCKSGITADIAFYTDEMNRQLA